MLTDNIENCLFLRQLCGVTRESYAIILQMKTFRYGERPELPIHLSETGDPTVVGLLVNNHIDVTLFPAWAQENRSKMWSKTSRRRGRCLLRPADNRGRPAASHACR